MLAHGNTPLRLLIDRGVQSRHRLVYHKQQEFWELIDAFAYENSCGGTWHDCRVPGEVLLSLVIRQLQIIVGQNVHHDQLEQSRSVEPGRAERVALQISMCGQRVSRK